MASPSIESKSEAPCHHGICERNRSIDWCYVNHPRLHLESSFAHFFEENKRYQLCWGVLFPHQTTRAARPVRQRTLEIGGISYIFIVNDAKKERKKNKEKKHLKMGPPGSDRATPARRLLLFRRAA